MACFSWAGDCLKIQQFRDHASEDRIWHRTGALAGMVPRVIYAHFVFIDSISKTTDAYKCEYAGRHRSECT